MDCNPQMIGVVMNLWTSHTRSMSYDIGTQITFSKKKASNTANNTWFFPGTSFRFQMVAGELKAALSIPVQYA